MGHSGNGHSRDTRQGSLKFGPFLAILSEGFSGGGHSRDRSSLNTKGGEHNPLLLHVSRPSSDSCKLTSRIITIEDVTNIVFLRRYGRVISPDIRSCYGRESKYQNTEVPTAVSDASVMW